MNTCPAPNRTRTRINGGIHHAGGLIHARKAMILWNDGPARNGYARVGVLLHPPGQDYPFRNLEYSEGACTSGWADPSDEVMLDKIQALAWYIIRTYAVAPETLHKA